MAVGDAVAGISSIAAGAVLSLQPAGTVEWVIHNILHQDSIDLQQYDGANTLTFDTDAGVPGRYGREALHCTNAVYYRVKNNHGSVAKLIGYDGIITHA